MRPRASKWGKVRAANGHPDPYRVKYWEIDNEIWSMKADDYADLLRQFVPAMKQVDPSIKTIACGSGQLGGHWPEGDIAVIEKAADLVDFLSVHHYEGPDHYADGPAKAEAFFAGLGERIREFKKSRPETIRIGMERAEHRLAHRALRRRHIEYLRAQQRGGHGEPGALPAACHRSGLGQRLHQFR